MVRHLHCRLLNRLCRNEGGASTLSVERRMTWYQWNSPRSLVSLSHRKTKQMASVELATTGLEVHIDFEGDDDTRGPRSIFHAAWLWSNDPRFVHTTSGQRLQTPGHYNGEKIHAVDIVEMDPADLTHLTPPHGSCHPVGGIFSLDHQNPAARMLLRIQWESSDQESLFDLNWLSVWRSDTEALARRRDSTEVNIADTFPKGEIKTFSYNELSNSEGAVFCVLKEIFQSGATLIQNSPLEMDEGTRSYGVEVAERIAGGTSHGLLYGETFHVQSVVNANNVAFTSLPLEPHQDLAYYESMPGLQLLHCVENRDVHGGQSTLVDAMAAAHSFRNLAPDLFEILTQCPATFVKQREGGDMLYFRPHIVLDPFGEITTVNWSPPFEGPLGVPADMVKDYYVAYTAFQKMVDNSLPAEHGSHTLSPSLNKALSAYANEYTWEQALRPGEILVFNNRRMLHGRRGFSIKEGTNGSRHLIGCYANIDETLNRYRLLLRQNARDQDWTIKNAGNGSVGTCFPSREPTSQT